ncbi:MAG TPA: tetratricopeptide repeat protein [Bryobacteraceae bacterium]|nr:tetratricopeptide repeat protein [Bryobacteraceae bacterium]HXJ40993.1 tetratricopeptide repeat protein [Bryobacteraceae bacterium]
MRSRLLMASLLAVSFIAFGADVDSGLRAYERGDYATALREWIPVAENGDARLQFLVGQVFRLSQQPAEGVRWFRKAAEQGFPQAEFSLGVIFENGTGVVQDYVAAAKWYRKASEHGLAAAQLNLAMIYANGHGVKQDYAEASNWCRKAAEQGSVEAQFGLGRLFANGGPGLKRNYTEAAYWYRKAAEQNHTDSQASLCGMYVANRGVHQDDSEAAKWCDKAAQQGNVDAQLMLGGLYATGQGVSRDVVTAYMWITLALPEGPKASELRDELAKEMTPSQIAQATELANNWRPRVTMVATDSMAALTNAISALHAIETPPVSREAPAPITQASIQVPLNFEKLRRYIDSEMLGEAVEEAKRLLRTDEFNAELHFAMGEVLFRMASLEEAARHLTISQKLSPSLWQAAERLADTHFLLWEKGRALSNRVAAAELYEQVASFKAEDRQISVFSHPNNLIAAQRRVLERSGELESPVGVWKTDYGELYRITRGDSLWGLNPVNQNVKYPLHASLSPPRGAMVSGRAELHSLGGSGGCLCTLLIELRFYDHSTRMDLDGILEKMIAPSPQMALDIGLKDATRFCSGLGSRMSNTKIIKMSFVRVE